jgi:hypothetical protein
MNIGCGLISGYTASTAYLDIPRAGIGISRHTGGLCERGRFDTMRGTSGYYERFSEEMGEFNIGIYRRVGGSKLTS